MRGATPVGIGHWTHHEPAQEWLASARPAGQDSIRRRMQVDVDGTVRPSQELTAGTADQLLSIQA
ncbi:MAG: hypothetical protein BGP23_09255 [Lysobacterales bacterium 66-474]|nr:MAG: hypothetical protein BGP23_09255 [Xanthomonadales bacterium 66-474]